MSIEFHHVSKSFRIPIHKNRMLRQLLFPTYTEQEVISDLSFHVDAGESVAYIGPTGAGKSTTIRMLAGMLHPSRGEIRVFGTDPVKEREKNAAQIGLVFAEKSQLWPHVRIEDTLLLMKDLYRIEAMVYQKRHDMLVEMFGLEKCLMQLPNELSKGQRVLADFTAALLHSPKVLFLDEPMSSLDLMTKERVLHLIRDLQQEEGMTVFMTSHDLQDIEAISSRIMVLDQGRLISDVSRQTLEQLFARDHGVRITMQERQGQILEYLHQDSRILSRLEDPYTLVVMFDQTERTAYDVIQMVDRCVKIRDIEMISPDMKLVIQKLYQSEMQIR